jgi:hypothetical protein
MNDYDRPTDKDIYIAENGWHFNKKACDYAVQYLKGKDGKRIKPLSKEEVDAMLAKYGIKLEKNRGWDYVYAANMAKSDMEGSPLSDEKSHAMYVKILIDDPDAADGEIMACWYVKMLFRREPVDWGMFL